MADFIEAKQITYRFARRDEEGEPIGEISALAGVNLAVSPGQFVAILGPNGSGKSTFARHINALLTPAEGTLTVDGRDTSDPDAVDAIRQAAGMIFQNPDNQIVAGVVEEDVAFGPENLGIPSDEIEARVAESLAAVEMADARHLAPDTLSGGQKQRVAVAGVLAMRPRCILLDEACAMLDPAGRREVMDTVRRLHREAGVTILWITHDMEEVLSADYAYVLYEGRVALEGTPRELFARSDALRRCGLELPQMARLAETLRADDVPLPPGICTRAELADALDVLRLAGGSESPAPDATDAHPAPDDRAQDSERAEKLRLSGVTYTYAPKSAQAVQALCGVDLTIYGGEILGLAGPTGSGKSTLIQMMNGLLCPDAGTVCLDGQDIHAPDAPSLRQLRGRVGLVFQFAEDQLFETTVLRDVAYGPKNQGLSEEEAFSRAREALRLLGMDETWDDMSPFELSGGQRRRAAIAGVLAMAPEVLILDEPTAGLDPRGKEELFERLRALRAERGMTVVIVSHDMENLAELCDRVAVLSEGQILREGRPADLFPHIRAMEAAHLDVPEVTRLTAELAARGWPIRRAVTVDAARREIERLC